VATVEFREATLDTDANLFVAPTRVAKGDWINLRIYPNGREDDYHLFNSLHVSEVTHEGEAGVLQPVTARGTSDGVYYTYGEDKP
jgi:hypothetical protein